MEIELRIHEQARRAAKSALVQWFSGQWQRQAEHVDDLTNELIVWYSENPSTRSLAATLSDPQVMVTFRKHALQILAGLALESDVFEGKVLYSSTSIKDALKGESSNKFLMSILPIAFKRLSDRYQDALSERYFGDEPVYPDTVIGKHNLRLAHKALTKEVNVLYITAETKGVGSSSAVFPDSVKAKGDHSDPTANLALTLMGQHPDLTDEYQYESPWEQVCYGAASEPVLNMGPSGRYRLTAEEAKLFRRVPGLIEMFIEQKQKEWA